MLLHPFAHLWDALGRKGGLHRIADAFLLGGLVLRLPVVQLREKNLRGVDLPCFIRTNALGVPMQMPLRFKLEEAGAEEWFFPLPVL